MSKQRPFYLGLLLALLGVLGFGLLRNGRGEIGVTTGPPRSGDESALTKAADPASGTVPEPVKAVESFDGWRESYLKTSVAGRPALVAQGVVLADARRKVLAELARKDPARAVSRLLSLAELAGLPAAVRAACEVPLSTMGSIDLRWGTRVDAAGELECDHQSVAFAGGQSWRVNGPDYRDARPPRADVAIDGYLIDGELLIPSGPVRKLDAANLTAASRLFPRGNADGLDPLTGNPAGPDSAALIGGKIFRFENDRVIDQVIARLAEADREATIKNVFKPDTGFRWLEADGGTVPTNGNPPVEATPFLTNTIKVLYIRVDFSDKPGAPATAAELQTSLTNTNTHLQNYSYGAATLTPTVSSTVYRMPSPSTTYSGNTTTGSDSLLAAARSAAAANYTLANYDVVGVHFPALSGTDFSYAGLASIGGANQWLNGLTSDSSRVNVMVHEFGHNYGLYHSNYYDPARQISGSYNDPGLASLEYGDVFDRMGSAANASDGYFGPFSTSRLNWLPAGKTVQPAANGIWRIYRFDAPTALTNPLIALRVPMGGNEYWWVGYRRLFPALATSAYVVAEGLYTNRPNLIDMTPGSQTPETNDRSDAGLPVGSQFYEPTKGVTFRTLASGGTAPNEWIEVQIVFDSHIQLATTAVEVDEQAGSAVLTLSRTFGSAGVATVNYATANGTATAGSDYYAVSGSVTWADGDATDKQVLVPLRPDALNDGGENFTLTLSGVVGGTLVASQSVATVTLRDAGQRFTAFNATYFNSTVKAIVPLAGGKVLIGGILDAAILGNIARLNADGTNDSTFLKGTGFNGEVRSIVVQSDGQILVGGAFTSYNSTPCNRLVRLSSNGAVDGAFVTAMGAGADAAVAAIAIETTGKILVGGDFTTFASGTMEGLVRLTALGARDTANALTLPFEPSWNTSVNALIAQDDGKIMAVGSFYHNPVATGFHSGIARLNANGSRDTSFDPDAGLHGLATNDLRTAQTIIRQPDGKYLVAGSFSKYDENPAPNIARVNSNGTFDGSFVPPAFDNLIAALSLQPSGAIAVGGWFTSPVSGLERLLANGTVDANFQQGTGPNGSIYALAQDSDSALWVGGNFYSYNGVSNWPVVKVAGGVSAYDAWVSRNFTAAQITAGIADPTADSDNDGVTNLAEMALGSSPTAFNTTNLFAPLVGGTGLVVSGPAVYLKSTFARSASNPGVWLTAQFSSTLGTWQPADPLPGANTTYDILEDSTSRFTVRDKTPANAATPKRFVRFVVRKPE